MGSYGGITLGLGGSPSIIRGTQIAKGGLLSSFSGASAAYSLRDLGGNVDKVVRVRRDVDGDGTDKERDFRADEVQTGTLENWINGKLENTLPADVATAAAAYSLRKVKADYSGNAVRIRRSSDDIEVDVAFDSDDKVSASSAITNVAEQGGESGQTTATTLGDFINGTDAFVHTWYDQAGSNDAVQATATNQPKIAEGGALLADGIDFDGTNDRLVSSSGISVTTSTDISFNIVGESDDITTTQTILSQKSGTGQGRSWTDIISSNFRSSIGGSAKTFGSVGSNGTQFLFTYILDESANTADAFKNSTQSGSQQTVNNAEAADGEIVIGCNNVESSQFLNGHLKEVIIYTSDQTDNRFKIESNINNYYGLYTFQGDGFVETWYDQSGNGRDATQVSAGNQPAIVQNGLLNTDGVDFDGSNDSLDITNSLPITGSNARSVFAVVNKDVSSSGDNIFGIGDNTNNVNSQLWNLASTYGLYYNGGNTVFGAGSLNTEQLITAIYPSTATDSGDTVFFIDGSSSSITSSADTTLATDNTVSRIGKGGGSLSGVYDGSIQELIVFDSDKLSDRTDIEQDIKNFYNI